MRGSERERDVNKSYSLLKLVHIIEGSAVVFEGKREREKNLYMTTNASDHSLKAWAFAKLTSPELIVKHTKKSPGNKR